MNEEEIYTFNEYILGYEKGNNDGSCLTISKIINDDMYFMSSLYDDSADVISMILDNLQKENKKLKQQLQQRDNIINKSREIIDKFYVSNNFVVYDNNDITKAIIKLEEILDNKGE